MIDMTVGSIDRAFFDKYVAHKQKKEPYFFTREYMQQSIKKRLENMKTVVSRDRSKVHKEYPSEDPTVVDLALKRIGFSFELSLLADDILDYALYSRYIKGSISDLLNGLYTFGRLHFLGHIVKPDSTIHSCSIESVTLSAGYDRYMLKRLSEEIEEFTPLAYGFSPVIVKGLQALTNGERQNKNIAVKALTRALNPQGAPWNNAVCSCLITIITHDNIRFMEFFNDLLAIQIPKRITGTLVKYISFPAHTIYRLAYQEFGSKGVSLSEPSHKLWDADFWHYLKSTGDNREHIIDFKTTSPVLAQWLDQLPKQIDLDMIFQDS